MCLLDGSRMYLLSNNTLFSFVCLHRIILAGFCSLFRSTGLGITAGFGFIGAILAPYTVFLVSVKD